MRYNAWKVTFKTIKGNLFTGTEEETNVPLVTNLRQDPWERYQTESMMYARWWGDKLWTLVPSAMIVGQFLATFRDYPQRQKAGSFNVDEVLAKLKEASK